MLFDTHVHSKYSADSQAPPEEIIFAAERLGLGVIFTEHVDYDFPEPGGSEFVADAEAYLREYASLKSPRVLTGLETGLNPIAAEKNAVLAADGRLDFVVGSVHLVHGLDIWMPEFWSSPELPDPKAAYLERAAEMAETGDFFDALGHIDYPSRYCPFEDQEMRYRDYIELYGRIFDALIKNGKVLEINTARLAGNRAKAAEAARSLGEICAAYSAMGGKYVTIGSDAHKAADVGRGFDDALKIAGAAGLEPVFFRERKMYKSFGAGENMA